MSLNAIEKALYDIGTRRHASKEFVADSDLFLSQYLMTDDEKALLKNADVAGMREKGANAMLLMGYWVMVRGPREMGEYMKQMKQGAGD